MDYEAAVKELAACRAICPEAKEEVRKILAALCEKTPEKKEKSLAVGDAVRVLDCDVRYFAKSCVGHCGHIIAFAAGGSGITVGAAVVEFDEPLRDLYDCNGLCPSGRGRAFFTRQIERVG